MAAISRFEPRRLPRQARSRATFDAIIEATARVLVAEGYDRLNTNRVAQVAGVSVGSLYQYFPNKESLVLAVIRDHSIKMIELLAVSAQDLADAPIDVAVRTYVRSTIAAHASAPELHRALVQQAMHIGLEHLRELELQVRAIIRAWLERHRDEILPTDLEAASFVLVTSVEALIHGALLDDPERLAGGGLEHEICDLILRYLVGSAGPGR